ncbi:MAG: polysaccharide biosynthesis permease [Cytophagales bacterium]|nr:MAG: polysaccharide biosynthesis permease [Cytophagales bacterium]
MSVFKKLAGQTALYGVSSILGRTLNFLLTPLFATYLSVAEFGTSVDIYSIAAFLNIIYLFGFETTYFRFAKKPNQLENEIFNQAESTLISISVIFSALLVLFAHPIVNYLEYPNKAHYIYYLALILFSDTIVALPFARLRINNQAATFAIIKISNIVLNVLLNIFFLAVCKPIFNSEGNDVFKTFISYIYTPGDDVKYVFLSNLIANILIIPFFYKSLISTKYRFDFSLLKQMLKYAYPLVILGIAGMTNEMLSRIIFKKILPDNFYAGLSKQEALGIFGACYKLSMFMSLAIQSFRYAAEPFFFNQAQEKNAQKTFALVMKWFIISCLLLFLGISLNLEILGKIMLRKEAYQLGLSIVPILLLANMFLGICFNLSMSFKLTDNNIYGTYISIFGVLITIIFNILLVPHYGFMGSAITTLLCYVSMATAIYLVGKRLMPIPYNIYKYLLYILFASSLVYLNQLYRFDSTIGQFISSIFFLLFFCISVFLIEKKSINSIIK